MAKEPTLVFKLSQPDHFKCSACNQHPKSMEGRFDSGTDMNMDELIDEFRQHVIRWHPEEDVNQAAARIVREATEQD